MNKVVIWEKEQFNENLYFVPIELSITFTDKDGLMSFIDNAEKRILSRKILVSYIKLIQSIMIL